MFLDNAKIAKHSLDSTFWAAWSQNKLPYAYLTIFTSQIKSELGRILGKEAGMIFDVRATWDSKKPSILAVLEKSKNKDLQCIIGLLEDCDPGFINQEQGFAL